MDRRSLLRLVGMAPVAAVLPVAAVVPPSAEPLDLDYALDDVEREAQGYLDGKRAQADLFDEGPTGKAAAAGELADA